MVLIKFIYIYYFLLFIPVISEPDKKPVEETVIQVEPDEKVT